MLGGTRSGMDMGKAVMVEKEEKKKTAMPRMIEKMYILAGG